MDRKFITTSKSVQSLYKTRSINEFLKDQQDYADKKLKHLEEISTEREKIEDKTFKPRIDKKSKRMSSKEISDALTVHERLHKLSNKRTRGNVQKVLGMPLHHVQSQSIVGTQRNYLTEQLNIEETLN